MASPARAWRVFRGLPRRDRVVVVRAWCLLFLASPGLRLFGFGRMQAVLCAAADKPAGREHLAEAEAVALAVHRAAAWHPVRPNCLARSLVLLRLLRLRGLAAEIRIGVAKPGETLAAHAWVEHAGVALAQADAALAAYARFDQSVTTR